LSKLLINV